LCFIFGHAAIKEQFSLIIISSESNVNANKIRFQKAPVKYVKQCFHRKLQKITLLHNTKNSASIKHKTLRAMKL